MDSLRKLETVLVGIPERIVACSGGVDSSLLATVAHRSSPATTVVAHAVTPAVPPAATARVRRLAAASGWRLQTVQPGEFDDERYLSNPVDRCYHCKSHLYETLDWLAGRVGLGEATIVSGANVDDLAEYRPGLMAAAEHGVRHPFVEAEIGKAEIRRIAGRLGLDFADLPASPCLSSRLYTGTRVTPARLRLIDAVEELIRSRAGIGVVRCRIKEDAVVIEVGKKDRPLLAGP
ncbi:MAG: ATP-dependent sacrificial sulfur transferase LarE, partial [Acidimicrobiia bacterium]|nr:ATP-dependent sacrificial sulfur transferase LarE [Acidimicrobiia bacterium]